MQFEIDDAQIEASAKKELEIVVAGLIKDTITGYQFTAKLRDRVKELAAKSGLAHRKAVQEAVREALQEAKKACENLPAPESCSGVERSLWDVATMACAEAVGKVGAT